VEQVKLERRVLSGAQNKELSHALKPSDKAEKLRKRPQSTPPVPSVAPEQQYDSLVELATPVSGVSAFCQAVLSKIIPNEFWGKGLIQEHNKACFLKHVHQFIHLRRFESMCLHEAVQGMKV